MGKVNLDLLPRIHKLLKEESITTGIPLTTENGLIAQILEKHVNDKGGKDEEI